MTVTEQEVARYADRVRQALADLPPAARDELVEDLPEHLAEVAAEGTGSLVDRLGPPDAYAAELRAAAGVGARAAARNLDDRISTTVTMVRSRLRRIDARTGPIIGYAKASDFLRLLRPAWWVLRGYLAAMVVTVLTSGSFGLIPEFDNSVVAGLLLLTAAVIGSIWLGRRVGGFSRWARLATNAGSALVAILGFIMLVNVGGMGYSTAGYSPAYNGNPYSHVQDVYVYDSQGRLIEGARLFDQNGEPIRLGQPYRYCGQPPQDLKDPMHRTYPFCPQEAPFRFSPGPPASAPRPTPVPATSPTSAPSPSESPSPSSSGDPTEPANGSSGDPTEPANGSSGDPTGSASPTPSA